MALHKPHEILARIDDHTILDWVPIDLMFVAPYGRPVGRSQLGRMHKSGFDEKKLGIITLSLRHDGRYAIIDGNHRRHLAKDVGRTEMLARIFIDLEYMEEAALFSALNTIKAPSALEKFNARMEYLEPVAVDITRIVGEVGLRIAKTPNTGGEGTVSCIAALEVLYIERGPLEFTEVLNVIYAAWGPQSHAWHAYIINGFRQFWARYRDEVEFKRLVEQLQLKMPQQILAAAGAYAGVSESIPTRVGKQLVLVYNGRSRAKKLRDWPSTARNAVPQINSAVYGLGGKIVDRVNNPRTEPDD
jgi:hypothetical protein